MRYLALDLGDRRIGVALSDPTGLLARPFMTLRRASRVEDFTRLNALVAEQQVGTVVVGLPLNLDGSDSQQTAWVRDYSAALAAALPVPVELWDERLTSVEATERLRERGRRALSPGELDAAAAAVILQSYLDARRTPPAAAQHPSHREG